MAKRQAPQDDHELLDLPAHASVGARPVEPPSDAEKRLKMPYFRPDGRKIQSFSKPLTFQPQTIKQARAAARKKGYSNPIQERELRMYRRRAAEERRLAAQEEREERRKLAEKEEQEELLRRLAAGLPAREPKDVENGQKRVSDFFAPQKVQKMADPCARPGADKAHRQEDKAIPPGNDASVEEEDLLYDDFDDSELIASLLAAEEAEEDTDNHQKPAQSDTQVAGIIQPEEGIQGTQYRIIQAGGCGKSDHDSPSVQQPASSRTRNALVAPPDSSQSSTNTTLQSSATLLGDPVLGATDGLDLGSTCTQANDQALQDLREERYNGVPDFDMLDAFASDTQIQREIEYQTQLAASMPQLVSSRSPPQAHTEIRSTDVGNWPHSEVGQGVHGLEGCFESNTQIERELSNLSQAQCGEASTVTAHCPEHSKVQPEVSTSELEDFFISSTQLFRELEEESNRGHPCCHESGIADKMDSSGEDVGTPGLSAGSTGDAGLEDFFVSSTQLEREMTEETCSPTVQRATSPCLSEPSI